MIYFRATLLLLAITSLTVLLASRQKAVAQSVAGRTLADQRQVIDRPLAQYVAQSDESYQWRKRRDGTIGKTQYAELILTSQTWQDVKWQHQLFVLNPSSAQPDARHALLMISGGRWRERYNGPPESDQLPNEAMVLAMAAEQMKTPVAILMQVPFQPMFGDKYEDAIIAYTFEQFLQTGDERWPLLLPMVKSAVKAMDTVEAFAKQEWSYDLESFTITGASKRGWTTWLTGAVDARATAIAPMVIDVLNMQKHMEHQKAVWGEFSEQIADYTERGLDEQLDTQRGKELREIVDPYHYLPEIRQPKLLMIGTNDRYWPLDSLNLYWDKVEGERHILYVPNNGHGLKDLSRVIGSLTALHRQAAGDAKMPKLTWDFAAATDKLVLQVHSDVAPTRVQAWTANSPSRDFREAKFTAHAAKRNGHSYDYELPVPERGFTAVFGEALFGTGGFPLYLSTNVRIVGASEQ